MLPALLLAAALSSPAPPLGHELTGAVGYGTQGSILVLSWTGRRRWGGWFRLDEPEGPAGPDTLIPYSTQVYTTAGSIGVAWRAIPRLTVGIGYGHKDETTTVRGQNAVVLEERRDDKQGLAAIGTWTFPVSKTVGVAASGSMGPGGFGAAAGVTFLFF